MSEYTLRRVDGYMVSCISCGSEVPTKKFSRAKPSGGPFDREDAYLCEFCAMSFAGTWTEYPTRGDTYLSLRHDFAVLIAQAVNFVLEKQKEAAR